MGRQTSFLGIKVIVGFVAYVAFPDVMKESTDAYLNESLAIAADFVS